MTIPMNAFALTKMIVLPKNRILMALLIRIPLLHVAKLWFGQVFLEEQRYLLWEHNQIMDIRFTRIKAKIYIFGGCGMVKSVTGQ